MNRTLYLNVHDHPVAIEEYLPTVKNGRVVLINSATAVRQTYYRDLAKYLNSLGYICYTYDYRSIGKSKVKSIKVYNISFSDWGTQDYPAVAKFVMDRNPDKAYYLIGHSIGGGMTGMSSVTNKFEKIVLIGSHHGYWKHYDFWRGLMVYFHFGYVIPAISRILNYCSSVISFLGDNLSEKVAYEWSKSSKNKNSLISLLDQKDIRFDQIITSLLFISMDGDSIAQPKGVDALAALYTNAKCERMHIAASRDERRKLGHCGIFNKRKNGDLWPLLMEYLEGSNVHSLKQNRIKVA